MADTQTKIASTITLAAYIDARVGEVLRASSVLFNLCYQVQFRSGSDSQKLRKRNAQTAAVVTEGSAANADEYTISAGNTLTAKKVMVLNRPTEESELFGALTQDEIVAEQGAAIVDYLDTTALALASGFSNQVGTTTVDLLAARLAEAVYFVDAANAGGPIAFVLHPLQIYDVRNDIITASAPVWSNPQQVGLLDMQAKPNGFKGQIFGIDVYGSTHVPTANAGADYLGMCVNPQLAIAMGSLPGTRTVVNEMSAQYRQRDISTAMYVDFKEYFDGAGCGILSDK